MEENEMSEFNKIIGYESIKQELRQICDMFHNKEIYEKLGAKLPQGLLLYKKCANRSQRTETQTSGCCLSHHNQGTAVIYLLSRYFGLRLGM